MIQIYHCHGETNEVGADELYTLDTSANISSKVAGFRVPVPAFEVTRYGLEDVNDEEIHSEPYTMILGT